MLMLLLLIFLLLYSKDFLLRYCSCCSIHNQLINIDFEFDMVGKMDMYDKSEK